jgi:predicted nucleic acid-binding protein
MALLLDTGFLYATLNRAEKQHEAVVAAALTVTEPIILPIPVTTEVAYLLLRDLGPQAVADFVESLATTSLRLLAPQAGDYERAAEVIRQYHDARIDYVDAVIVALAERLNITRLLTLDQRHFRLIRPRHCSAFELLP